MSAMRRLIVYVVAVTGVFASALREAPLRRGLCTQQRIERLARGKVHAPVLKRAARKLTGPSGPQTPPLTRGKRLAHSRDAVQHVAHDRGTPVYVQLKRRLARKRAPLRKPQHQRVVKLLVRRRVVQRAPRRAMRWRPRRVAQSIIHHRGLRTSVSCRNARTQRPARY